MILQAESKKEYEEVSVKEKQLCFFLSIILHLHPEDICCYKYLSQNNGGAVATHLCGFHVWLCAWTHLTGLSQLVSVK